MNDFKPAMAGSPLSGRQLRLAEGLWRAAMIVLALMPVGMAIAHRSSPVFLVLSALLSLGAALVEGKGRSVLRQALSAAASPLGLAILAFCGWCLISIAWSEFRPVSLRAFAEFWLSATMAFVLALTLARRITRPAFWLLAGAITLACLSMVSELHTGLALRQIIGVRSYSFIFNRSVLTLSVLALPLLAWFVGHVRHGWAWALGLVVVVSGTALLSDSGAAVLGLIVAALTFAGVWAAPRAAQGLAAAALIIGMVAAPWLGSMANAVLPASVHQQLAGGHTRERVDVWLSFGEMVKRRPLIGEGFGTGPRMRDTAVAQRVPEALRPMLAIGHPHNAALQIWTELGAVGAVLALAILLLALRAIARLPRLVMSMSLALLAGAFAVAYVGHGAWQGWWAASLGAAVIWMIATIKPQPEIRP